MQQLIIVYILILSINAGVVKEGKCPDLKGIQNFDKMKILGWWYTIQSYSFTYDTKINCEKFKLTLVDSQNISEILHVIDWQTGKPSTTNASLQIIKPNIGEFRDALYFDGERREFILKVLDTDYMNYVIFYGCMEYGIDNYSYSVIWIASREKELSPELLQNVHNIIDRNHLNLNYLQETNQHNCNY